MNFFVQIVKTMIIVMVGCAVPGSVGAGTVIKVETEGGGVVMDNASNTINYNGALFWNGTDWGVNDTYGHMFFVDTNTGERLKEYTTLDLNTCPGPEVPDSDYTFEKRTYTYSIDAGDGSPVTYTYEAVEFEIVYNDPVTRKTEEVVLRSRGTGNGTDSAYFDVYIENMDEDGNLVSATALRGDPVWFMYDTLAEALAQSGDTLGKRGELRTDTLYARDSFWLDIDGGSDMGGLTYHFHAVDFDPSAVHTHSLGFSFIYDFSIMFTNDESNLIELHFTPEIIGEQLSAANSIYTYYVPYFRANANYWTGLGLRNGHDSVSATVTIYVYDSTGILSETTTKLLEGRGQSSFIVGVGLPDEGWIKVASTQPLIGLCFVATKGAGSHMADIPFASALGSSLIVPNVGQGPNFDTCILVCNPNEQATTVTLKLYNQSGSVVKTKANVIAKNGSWKYALSNMVADSTVSNMGSVEITATNDITAFALYDNLKTGGYGYSGITAVPMPSGSVSPNYNGQYIGSLVGTPVDGLQQSGCGHSLMDVAISGARMTGRCISSDDGVLTMSATVDAGGNIVDGTITSSGEGTVAGFWGSISGSFMSGYWSDTSGCSGMWCVKKQ